MTRLLLALTRLFPPSFRRAHGRELRAFIKDARADRTMSAPDLAGDLVVSIVREWLRLVGANGNRSGRLHQDPGGRTQLIGGLTRDVRHAARLLVRSPGFTVAAVLTLALGIGGNLAMFSLADATILRPLHVAAPDRLVAWSWTSAYPDYKGYAARRDVFDGVLAISTGRVSVDANEATDLTIGAFVSGNALDLLGVGATVGRPLVPADDVVNNPIVGVLSHDYWRSRFGADPTVVGRLIRVNSQPVTIVGVAEQGFRGVSIASSPSIYLPLTVVTQLRTGPFGRAEILETRNMVWLTVIGRLRGGVTAAQAAAAMDAQYRAWQPSEPDSTSERLRLIPLTTRALGVEDGQRVRRFVTLLLGVVAVTLLIGCANVANLLLARNASRRREVGIQLALGASRLAIARQSLAESLLLAGLGSVVGLGVAAAALRVLGAYQLPGGIDIRGLDLTLDGIVLGLAAGLAILTGLLFGVGPAWWATNVDVLSTLQRASSRHTGGERIRSVLVAAQVALCLMLLAGSGLFLKSLLRAVTFPVGFDVRGVIAASINPGLARFDRARAKAFHDQALERVRAIPAVEAAAWTALIPSNGQMVNVVDIDGLPASGAPPDFQVSLVGPDYFRAAGTRVLQGRPFSPDDKVGAAPVAIISNAAARVFWSGRDPIGGRIKPAGSEEWRTIVGVVDDVMTEHLGETPAPFVYYPFEQPAGGPLGPLDAAHLLVRTSSNLETLQPRIAQTLRSVDPDMPLYDVLPFAEHVRELLMPQRLGLMLMTFFSILAVSLAAVGIYGVATYVAELRSGELSIRIALGADRSAIRSLVVRRGIVPAAFGIAAGLLLALSTSRLLEAFLYDVSPYDPVTFVSVSLGLFVMAVLATWWPARRAARVDPVAALRQT